MITRVIHTIAGLRADHGGPSRSVTALADAQAACGLDVHIIAGIPKDPSIRSIVPNNAELHWMPQTPRWHLAKEFANAATRLTRDNSTVIHDHGLWLETNRAVARVSRAKGIPRIVSPRGMLSHWALSRRRWLKRCVWSLWQRRCLLSANAIHVTSAEEKSDVERIGCKQRISVVKNGVSVPSSLPPKADLPGRRILCLSRIHPVKGILELLEAFALAGLPANWQLQLAGPDEDGHLSVVQQRCYELKLQDRVHFLGFVDDQQKWPLLVNADLFVLPSFSENFGIVVAEAMVAGTPVITTTGTPWKCLAAQDLGWWVEPTVDSLVSVMQEATTLSVSQLGEKGQAASRFAANEFCWKEAALELQSLYKSLCSTPPAIAST